MTQKRPAAKKRPATKNSSSVRLRRLAFAADPSGPRIRFGFGWFLLQAAAFWLGLDALTLLYSVTAGVAGWQLAGALQRDGSEPEPWLSALFAGIVPVAAAFDTALIGAAILSGVVVTSVAGIMLLRSPARVLDAVGADIRCWLFVGLGAAGPIITYRYEPGAALVLLAFVAIYDSGAFLVGVDSSNDYEGPLAGLVGVGVVAFLVAVVAIPPFGYGSTMLFAMFAGLGCILGPLMGSLLLPKFDSEAPGLRRIDSLLVIGPFWAWTVGLLLSSLQ